MRSIVVAICLVGCARGGLDVLDGPPSGGSDSSGRGGDDGSNPRIDSSVPNDTSVDAPLMGGAHLVINEIDYDQVGTDSAEYVEIFNPGTGSASLSGLSVMFVNGATNTVYLTVDLSSVGSLAAGGYLVLAGAGVTVSGSATKLSTGWTTDAIQNGSPDGLALVDTNAKTVIDALSYEGSITAAQLTGFASPVSLVEGTALATSVADSNTVNGTLCRNPNGQDTDDANVDWKFCTMVTPGTANM